MSTRMNLDVTLSHADADAVSKLLQSVASERWDHARKTRSAVVRDYCQTTANEANRLAEYIVSRLYRWE